MTLGAPYVMIGLAQKKQLLSVGSWDLKRQVRKHGVPCFYLPSVN